MPRKPNAKKTDTKSSKKDEAEVVVDAKVIEESTSEAPEEEEEEIKFDFETADTSGYDPLEEDVKNEVQIVKTGEEEIPEPRFEPPPELPPEGGPAPDGGGGDSRTGDPGDSYDTPPPAPEPSSSESTGFQEITELPPEDKQIAAEQLTEVMLSGYAKLHTLGRWYAKFPEDELAELKSKDQIDPQMNVPLDETGKKHATIAEFIADYNAQVEEGMQVSDKFMATVRPAMIRICLKHGWGLTDEWLLAYMFGEDLSTKAGMLYGYKKTINMCMEAFIKAHAENKGEKSDDGLGETKKD